MNSKKKLVINALIFAALLAATFFLVFRGENFSAIMHAIYKANILHLCIASFIMLLYVFCGGYCIKVMFSYIGEHMSLKRCIKYSFIEFFFSALTPSSTGGQPMQVVSLSKDGYKASDSTVILIAIALLYRLTLIAFTVVFLIIDFSFALKFILKVKYIFILGIVLNVTFIGVLLLLLFSKRFIRIAGILIVKLICFFHIRKKKNISLYYEKINTYAENYHDSAVFMITHVKLMLRSFLILSLQRICVLIIPYFVYLSLGVHVPYMSLIRMMGLQLLLSVCVDIMPFPGSVGISESVFLYLYRPIFGTLLMTPALLLSRGINFYLIFILSAIIVNFEYISSVLKHKRKKS